MIPPDPAETAKLAGRYESKDLGPLRVSRAGASVVFDMGEWRSSMASRKNDDGSISFMTISPDIIGLDFVVSERNGKRALVTRSAQQEYVFIVR